MQISFVLAQNCTSANCTSKQTNKMNMDMLNLVETRTILIMILFCKFSFCNSLSCLILWAIAWKVACALLRVSCIVQCLVLCHHLFKTCVQRLNLLQGQAILEPKQKKTQACISLGRTLTFKKSTFHYYRYKNHK